MISARSERVESQISKMADGLASDKGYSVTDDFLTSAEVSTMLDDFSLQQNSFIPARVGREADLMPGLANHAELRTEIRSDSTLWFDPEHLTESQTLLWDRLENVRRRMNEHLMLGLWELEGHYASYMPGGFYRRHLDRFRSDDRRTVSLVFYLNEGWKPIDGGALRVYTGQALDNPSGQTSDQTSSIDIEPLAGRLVCFLSDRIEHEVMDSTKERKSFAGWFRRRS